MRMHKRTAIVSRAQGDLKNCVCGIVKKHGLTHGELTKILASELLDWNKYLIRGERHPGDPDKKGDEE